MFTYPKWTLMVDWYGGPENTGTNVGWRSLYDATLTITPSSKFAFYINSDYGQNRNTTTFPNPPATTNLATWAGVAGAVHIQATSKWAFTPRIEWFGDHDGFETLTPQNLQEFTFTGEYKILEGLLWRAEYRHDWSDKTVFESGCPGGTVFAGSGCVGVAGANSKSQNTATVAMIAYFGPKR